MRRARIAASNTNNLLEGLIELDAIKYLKPMMYRALARPFNTVLQRLMTALASRITSMIPAMQIHLADCKSTNSLNRGLGRNKLQLCMLVLSNLKATYWSANVMYRLFYRAQTILGDSDGDELKSAKGSNARPRTTIHPDEARDVMDAERQQLPQQDQKNGEHAVTLATSPASAIVEQPKQPEQLWFDISPQFTNIEQLLSPGFSLSEDTFLDFFPNYPTVVAHNQAIPLPNSVSDETLYDNFSF